MKASSLATLSIEKESGIFFTGNYGVIE